MIKPLKPNVGDTWVADETVIKIGGKKYWLLDIICPKTRFLLATHLSPNRGTPQARILMELASERAGKVPKVVVTDSLRSYPNIFSVVLIHFDVEIAILACPKKPPANTIG